MDAAGGRTQLHNLFSNIILIIVVYALAFLLAPLPKATLSAIVYVSEFVCRERVRVRVRLRVRVRVRV